MHSFLRRLSGALGAILLLGILPAPATAQQAESAPPFSMPGKAAAEAIPDAPLPQFAMPAEEPAQSRSTQNQGTQNQDTKPSANAQESTSTQGQAPANGDAQKASAEEQRRKAQEQLEQQEHQRVMGVMATFNTTQNRDALPLSTRQKFQLFFKSETDPWPFLLASVVAGVNQANDSDPEWGQGVQGYAKRFGGAYADSFIGNFFGNAVLTSWWHEDPRYFQKGTGSKTSRFLWAASSTVWCKRDKGTWGPNYANLAGNLIGSAIARIYYPASERHVGDTITDGLTVSAEGIVGAEVIEFWPDMVRHHQRKKAEKLAREAAKKNAQDAPKAPDQPKQEPPQ